MRPDVTIAAATIAVCIACFASGWRIGRSFPAAPPSLHGPSLVCPPQQWRVDALDACEMILRQSLATSDACLRRLDVALASGGAM